MPEPIIGRVFPQPIPTLTLSVLRVIVRFAFESRFAKRLRRCVSHGVRNTRHGMSETSELEV